MATATCNALDVFEAVCADKYATAREAAERGTEVAGYMCSYAPQELLHAAGYMPVRILGRPGNTPLADEVLQQFACSFARSTFDSALADELDFLALVVFSHTCDTMQGLAELWKRRKPGVLVLTLSVPTVTDGDLPRVFFRTELLRVRECLEKLGGDIPDSAIRESIGLYQRHKKMMQRLYALRRAHPERLSGREMMSVVMASYLMPREEHLELLAGLLESLECSLGILPKYPLAKPRVLVAGSVCQDLGFIAAIEEAGCAVVDDDLCMGSRTFVLPDATEGDPLSILTEQYLSRAPCPAFHKPGFDPGTNLLDKAKEANVDGVVFLLTKFCDPWAFDYPRIATVLEEAGVPLLMLEVEQHLPVPAQLRTRTEAFVEMLQTKAAS